MTLPARVDMLVFDGLRYIGLCSAARAPNLGRSQLQDQEARLAIFLSSQASPATSGRRLPRTFFQDRFLLKPYVRSTSAQAFFFKLQGPILLVHYLFSSDLGVKLADFC